MDRFSARTLSPRAIRGGFSKGGARPPFARRVADLGASFIAIGAIWHNIAMNLARHCNEARCLCYPLFGKSW